MKQQLKSPRRPTAKAYAIFENRSPRVVDILWFDFDGLRVNYTRDGHGLKLGYKMNMNTFEEHPWIFRDHDSGDKLVCLVGTDRCSREVFIPVPVDDDKPCATHVSIHIPVYTLLERSLQVVRKLVKNKSDFDKLEIPAMLKSQLANPEDTVNW